MCLHSFHPYSMNNSNPLSHLHPKLTYKNEPSKRCNSEFSRQNKHVFSEWPILMIYWICHPLASQWRPFNLPVPRLFTLHLKYLFVFLSLAPSTFFLHLILYSTSWLQIMNSGHIFDNFSGIIFLPFPWIRLDCVKLFFLLCSSHILTNPRILKNEHFNYRLILSDRDFCVWVQSGSGLWIRADTYDFVPSAVNRVHFWEIWAPVCRCFLRPKLNDASL